MINVLVYGIDVGDATPISNLHLGAIARRYKDELRELGVNLLTMNIYPPADIVLDIGMSIYDVLRRLPSDWEPDFILIQGPEYLFLPRELYRCEYPIVFVTCDYDYDILRSYHFFSIADCVVCFSDDAMEEIRRLGARKVVKFPFWLSFEHRLSEDDIKHIRERKTDIFYSGNTNLILMKEKATMFYHLAKFLSKNKSLKYEVRGGYLEQNDYVKNLLDSKLSITYHRRREVQRPEVILCGGILITNSKEFGSLFKEGEDFFVYERPEDIGTAIERAMDFLHSSTYEHDRRTRRLMNIGSMFHPIQRFYELVHHVYNNLGRSSAVSDRTETEKIEHAITDILSWFQPVDIYSIQKTKREKILSALRNIIDGEEERFFLLEDSPFKRIFESYRAIVDFILSGEHKIKDFGENYVLPLDLSLLELSRFNYGFAIEYLDVARKVLSDSNVSDSTFLKFLPILSSVIPPQFFPNLYFPEYRGFFPSIVNDVSLKEEHKDFLLSYVEFVRAVLIRDTALPMEPVIRNSISLLDKACSKHHIPRYKIEKAKSLVKIADFDGAFDSIADLTTVEQFDLTLAIHLLKNALNEDAYFMLDLFLSSDPSCDVQSKELFLSFFQEAFKSSINNSIKPHCSCVVYVGNNLTSASVFAQNVLHNIYPYVRFYAISSDRNIRNRLEKIFPKKLVRFIEGYEEIEKDDSKVFIFVPDSVLLDQVKVFFDSVVVSHLGALGIISQGRSRNVFVLTVRDDVFWKLKEERTVPADGFVRYPLLSGVVLFDPTPLVSVEEDRISLSGLIP